MQYIFPLISRRNSARSSVTEHARVEQTEGQVHGGRSHRTVRVRVHAHRQATRESAPRTACARIVPACLFCVCVRARVLTSEHGVDEHNERLHARDEEDESDAVEDRLLAEIGVVLGVARAVRVEVEQADEEGEEDVGEEAGAQGREVARQSQVVAVGEVRELVQPWQGRRRAGVQPGTLGARLRSRTRPCRRGEQQLLRQAVRLRGVGLHDQADPRLILVLVLVVLLRGGQRQRRLVVARRGRRHQRAAPSLSPVPATATATAVRRGPAPLARKKQHEQKIRRGHVHASGPVGRAQPRRHALHAHVEPGVEVRHRVGGGSVVRDARPARVGRQQQQAVEQREYLGARRVDRQHDRPPPALRQTLQKRDRRVRRRRVKAGG